MHKDNDNKYRKTQEQGLLTNLESDLQQSGSRVGAGMSRDPVSRLRNSCNIQGSVPQASRASTRFKKARSRYSCLLNRSVHRRITKKFLPHHILFL